MMKKIINRWRDYLKKQSLSSSIIFIALISIICWILSLINTWIGIHGIINPNMYEYILLFQSDNHALIWVVASLVLQLLLLYFITAAISLLIKGILIVAQVKLDLKKIWIAVAYAVIIFPVSLMFNFITYQVISYILSFLIGILSVFLFILNFTTFNRLSKKVTIILISILLILVLSIQIIFPIHKVTVPEIKDFSGTINGITIFNSQNIISICQEPKCLNLKMCSQKDNFWSCGFSFPIFLDSNASDKLKRSINELKVDNDYLVSSIQFLADGQLVSEVRLSEDLQNNSISKIDVLVIAGGSTKREAAVTTLVKVAQIQKLVLSK